jgi:hypothetical protein
VHEDWPADDEDDEVAVYDTRAEALDEEHFGELAMCQRECPETQVRGGVGDGV